MLYPPQGWLSTGKILNWLPAYCTVRKWKYDILGWVAAAQVFLMIHSVLLFWTKLSTFFFVSPFYPRHSINIVKKSTSAFAHMKHLNSTCKRLANICQSSQHSQRVQLVSTTFKTVVLFYFTMKPITNPNSGERKKKSKQSNLFCLQGEFCPSARTISTIRFLIRLWYYVALLLDRFSSDLYMRFLLSKKIGKHENILRF